MGDTYDYNLDDLNLNLLHDNCLVKMQVRTKDYKTDAGLDIPKDWVEKSPKKTFYGVVLDYGTININRFSEDDEIRKAKAAKRSFRKAITPLEDVVWFSRARFLPIDHNEQGLAIVKQQNCLFAEPYKEDTFEDKDDFNVSEIQGDIDHV